MGKQTSEVPVSSTSAEWVDPNGRHWMLDTWWSGVDGRHECIGFAVRSFGFTDKSEARGRPVRLAEGVHPVGVDVLRAITMGLLEERRRSMVDYLEYAGDHAELAASFKRGPKRRITVAGADGQPLSTDDALAAVARVYGAAWRAGENPTAAVAETFTLSRSAAAKRVSRARAAGLLPATSKGQARGSKEAST